MNIFFDLLVIFLLMNVAAGGRGKLHFYSYLMRWTLRDALFTMHKHLFIELFTL